ncbi:uncharacterized protein LOC8050444 isoform X2 [Ixodes scapularis]|uniref:uncharacterized protein LOC8050444 isoform X2 n=1 Tax=Ixodes scapularis TaxID=6945 RepID=UPI001A9EF94C|nr:uncharacterized protein LOC8050444 isoform X2 [Ixodes scapularis]
MLTPASREWRPRSVALIARASRAAGASRTAEPAAPSAGPATCCSNLVLPRTARGMYSLPLNCFCRKELARTTAFPLCCTAIFLTWNYVVLLAWKGVQSWKINVTKTWSRT